MELFDHVRQVYKPLKIESEDSFHVSIIKIIPLYVLPQNYTSVLIFWF